MVARSYRRGSPLEGAIHAAVCVDGERRWNWGLGDSRRTRESRPDRKSRGLSVMKYRVRQEEAKSEMP